MFLGNKTPFWSIWETGSPTIIFISTGGPTARPSLPTYDILDLNYKTEGETAVVIPLQHTQRQTNQRSVNDKLLKFTNKNNKKE